MDTLSQVYLVNRETGKLATIYTPPELVEERVYIILPPEAQDWIDSLPEDSRAQYQPPAEYDTIYGPESSPGRSLDYFPYNLFLCRRGCPHYPAMPEVMLPSTVWFLVQV